MKQLWKRRDEVATRPLPYSLLARLSDRWAGVRDGRAGIPLLDRDAPTAAEPRSGVTPYLDIQARHFMDRAEHERRRAVEDLDEHRQRRQALRQEIAAADERVAEVRRSLDSMPAVPDEAALTQRNVIELHADEVLVRDRRHREHNAGRARLLAEVRQAVEAVATLRVEECRLAELIAIREQILDIRVRRLHQHTLRRCSTYKRHLVHKHPEGAAVIPLLDLGLPTLPGWLGHAHLDAHQTTKN